MATKGKKIILLTLDQEWRFIDFSRNGMGHPMVRFRDSQGDEIIFEVVDAAAAEEFLAAAEAIG